MKSYEVCFEIRGTYKTKVTACNENEAEEIAYDRWQDEGSIEDSIDNLSYEKTVYIDEEENIYDF